MFQNVPLAAKMWPNCLTREVHFNNNCATNDLEYNFSLGNFTFLVPWNEIEKHKIIKCF